MPRFLLTLPFWLAFAAGNVLGEMVWESVESEAEVVVADTAMGFRLPSTGEVVPFTNFGSAHFGSSGEVTFIVDDPVNPWGYGTFAHHGIYYSPADGGPWIPLAELNRPLSSSLSISPAYLSALQSDGYSYVFHSILNGNSQDQSLFLWRPDSGIETIASTGMSNIMGFRRLGHGSVSGDLVVFQAQDRYGRSAIYLYDRSSRKTHRLVDTDCAIPGTGGKQFAHFSLQPWIGGNAIVFRADAEKESPGTSLLQPEDDGLGNSAGIYGWRGIDPNDAATWSLARLITFVDGSIEGPLGRGEKFSYLGSATACDDLVAFHGGWFGRHGIHVVQEDVHTLVVDTQTQIPDLFEGTFTDFDPWVAVMPGKAIFVARAGNDYSAIFLYQANQDQLYRLYDSRTPIEGKEISGFEVSGNVMIGDQFAAIVRFKDHSSGIYLFRMPSSGFARR